MKSHGCIGLPLSPFNGVLNNVLWLSNCSSDSHDLNKKMSNSILLSFCRHSNANMQSCLFNVCLSHSNLKQSYHIEKCMYTR